MKELVWSERALSNLDQAVEHIARSDKAAADLIVDRITAAARLLAQRPIGRRGRVPGTFEKRVLRTSYIIVYEIIGAELTILRVIHERRQWDVGAWPRD